MYQRAGQGDCCELSEAMANMRDMKTIVSLEGEDRKACEDEVRAIEQGLAAAKERDALKRFGLLSFEDYLSWVINQSAVRRS